MDKTKNKKTGNLGEEKTAEYLEQKGYKILDRNLVLPMGEIDILAKDKNTIVIVEVKTVRGDMFGAAVDLVRYKKQQKLKLLARAIEQQYPTSPIRIDVIGVQFSSGEIVFDHIENAIYE